MGLVFAALWGFAESTLFFIVPDVWLTRLVITHSLAYALKAAVYASLGAMAGGALLVFWSTIDTDTAYRSVESVPAISEPLMQQVKGKLEHAGWVTLFPSAFLGIPYKTFAVQITQTESSVLLFLLATIPARLSRFFLAVAICNSIAAYLKPKLQQRGLLSIWLVFWCLFYLVYFSLMDG